ncbi:EamA family transporter RarD [Metabacillus niabensis]|uniref:Chloramphenicol-sensitive protein RarD n=1 Tax=Metabacillus niabensis TaxID=324854 RepID=A0ABT9YZ29_9BACI|nr:EamA family transporter RarD [Metabacillus niabensis]MDQ0225250.1 chloramphenicol-sensitive protein RarD [Metabacillus niabensis]
MQASDELTYRKGIIFTAGSYLLWGVLPLYWKKIDNVSSGEILAHRIIWSFIFMLILLSIQKEWGNIVEISKKLFSQPLVLLSLVLSSLLISINWFVYIWSVNHNHILETSLGYYINPLISVLLGMIFLKEKLNLWQKISMGLAFIGVLIITLQYGEIPWLALILAGSFGLYGLTKKMTKFNSVIGLTFETLVVTPIAFTYVSILANGGESVFFEFDTQTNLLLIGAGVATAIPLLLFASGAKRIPLFLVGIIQYISPTITLIIGIFLYHEPFTQIEMITFTFIWSAILLFSFSNSKLFKRAEVKLIRKNSIGL